MSESPPDPFQEAWADFGRRLRRLREKRKMSMDDVVRKWGHPKASLHNIEKGKAFPRIRDSVENLLIVYYGREPDGELKEEFEELRSQWEEIVRLLPERRGRVALKSNGYPVFPWLAAPPASDLSAFLDALAVDVERQWRNERLIKAIPMRWTFSWDVADHRDVVLADGDIAFEGDLDATAEVLDWLPHHRLVLLGESGMGKTVALAHLVLGRIRRREPGGPVPVMLTISEWNPSAVGLVEWLVEQLVARYPSVRSSERASEIVGSGLVIPVLDGFDEIPQHLRPVALTRINNALPGVGALVLSSRGKEFRAAVRHPRGRVLEATAVAEAERPPVNVVAEYLRLVVDPHRLEGWEPVLARLTEEPDGPLAATLTTPLMAWLALADYGEGTAHPTDLLGFTDQRKIEDHLLSRLVPTRYHPFWAKDSGPEPTADRKPLDRVPTLANAQRWLAFLDDHMRHVRSSELAWWRVELAVPRPAIGTLGGLVFALVVAVAVGLPSGLLHGTAIGLWWGCVGGAVAGLLGGTALCLLAASQQPHPSVVRLRPWRARRHLTDSPGEPLWRHVTEGFGTGALSGACVALVVALAMSGVGLKQAAIASASSAGVAVMLAIGIARTLDFWVSAPTDDTMSISPVVVFRNDRAVALMQGLVGGLAFGLAFGLSRGIIAGGAAGAAAAVTRCFIGGLDQGLSKVHVTAWGRFMIASLWLAVTRRAPLRMMAFLQDADYRGLLRREGAVYRFRHERLAAVLPR
ncbi:helix-turn-helix domain-containing protein [Saccharothrix coeruleofusca]|nr:helix-turn-helix domain-containing protein [Saccharothrix coeruleofusca]